MERILLIRSSAIGDIVFASGFAAALRRSYPKAHIAWLVESGMRELLAANPDLDEVLVWPKGEWLRLWRARRYAALWREVRRFRRELRARRFDTAIDLQGLFKSGMLAWLSGAARRIGLGSREGSQHLMTEVIEKGGDPRRISSEYLYLAQKLGLDCGDFPLTVHVDPASRQQAARTVAELGIAGPYVVICPFTTRPQKHWLEDQWQMLIQRLQAEFGWPVLMLGGPADQDAAARIAAGAIPVHDLAGRTRLPEAAALIAQATLVIGVDTGLTHMGVALGRPTVALFGSTCPYLDPGSAMAVVIYKDLSCSPCRRRPSCQGAYTCMREIGVEEVLASGRGLLAREVAP